MGAGTILWRGEAGRPEPALPVEAARGSVLEQVGKGQGEAGEDLFVAEGVADAERLGLGGAGAVDLDGLAPEADNPDPIDADGQVLLDLLGHLARTIVRRGDLDDQLRSDVEEGQRP